METQNIKQILEIHYPELMEDALREEIEKVGVIEKVDQGEIVIDLDEVISHLPLLYKGTIKVHREDEEGNEILLYYLEAGNTCATSLTCCLSKKKSTIRAEAEEETWYISIPISYLDEWMLKYQSWKEFIMNTYALRFEELLLTVDELAFNKLDQRLLHYLKDKVKVSGSNTITVSHREIAYDLNSSREVISRLLKQLERMGDIKLGRGKIEMFSQADFIT